MKNSPKDSRSGSNAALACNLFHLTKARMEREFVVVGSSVDLYKCQWM